MAAYGGRVAWSHWDARARGYRLLVVDEQRGRIAVRVRPRSVPFDVDLGPGPDRKVTAVYSRCAREPELPTGRNELPTYVEGRGCDLYRYDFGARRERRIAARSLSAASEVLPAVWRRNVAFARVYERRRGVEGVLAHLYHGSLTSRAGPRRLPGGTRGDYERIGDRSPPAYAGGPGPVGLDLAGNRAAYAWDLRLERCNPDDTPDDLFAMRRSEIWVDRVDGPAGAGHHLLEYGCTGDETDYFRSPALAPDRLFYFRRLNVESFGGRLRAYAFAGDSFSESPAGHRAISVARDRGTTYYSELTQKGRIAVVRDTDLVFEPSARSGNE